MPLIIAAIVLSTAAGVWAEHRWGGRASAAVRRAMMGVLYFVLPPAIFLNLARAELDLDATAGLGFAYVALLTVAVVAWLCGSRLLRLTRPETGALICGAMSPNSGYLGYAVVAATFGFGTLGEAVAFDILVSAPISLIGVFGIGAAFGSRAGEGVRERAIAFLTRNPPLYAAIAGLLAPDALAPDLAVDISRVAMVGILPLGFFAVGAVLAEDTDAGRIGFPSPFEPAVGIAAALKLFAAPALLLALAAPLIDLPDSYPLLIAMPTGLNTIIVAHAYGLDLRITAAAIAWSTAVAVVLLSVGTLVV